ncbi:trypsin-like peptidase domain-containing protein [Rhodosalinus sp. 5P4]|uniref:trypsin-like peptidase domain-containing protein n=1 Tax=Rhodosalinus sp. 5P4 TaxID=3239196 RepID=UPI003523D12A
MVRVFVVFSLVVIGLLRPAAAQQAERVFVQVEALPSLQEAQTRARAYAARLPDVNGFALGAGWYAVTLGPYPRDDASTLLFRYRNAGLIPGDSYIARSSDYGQRFWPVGAIQRDPPATALPRADGVGTLEAPAPLPEPEPAGETPAEARRSEAALTRRERAELQEALRWAGFYGGAIDAAFGRGTRGAMADWQAANGHEVTGILTTRQRAALLGQYNAIFEELGLASVADATAGIEMLMPTAAVTFDRHEYPFAHYEATGEVQDARVLLISQAGDRDTLAGLFDIMQTLEIVPPEGPRTRTGDRFTLEGRNAGIVSYTEASLEGGRIKGFTLVWPADDETRRARLLEEMRESFTRLAGVLPPSAGSDDAQAVDLVSGLAVRVPRLSRSGFYIDDRGTVLTTAEAVRGCGRITLEGEFDARVVTLDEALGVAVLRPVSALAPAEVAAFSDGSARLRSEVAVSGYSFGGQLTAPTLTFGRLAALNGLQGETEIKRLDLDALPGDAGGPVFDETGAVMGLLLPRAEGDRQLPGDVRFAARSDALRPLIEAAGVPARTAQPAAAIAPEDLTRRAMDMTVLVSCWE